MNTKKRLDDKEISKKTIAVILISYIVSFYAGAVLSHLIFPQDITIIQEVPPPVLYSGKAKAVILAVRGDTKIGELGHVIVETRPGENRILVNTNPFVEPDTQQSVENAIKVAINFTNKNISGTDFIITFDTNATLIGGPSAGSSIAIASIAAISQREVREDVAITGSVGLDGRIGSVGGLIEKIQAASEKKMKMVLIPSGQGEIDYYEQQIKEEKPNPYTVVRHIIYVPRTLNLVEYAYEEWGIEVREVSNINEAAGYLLI